MKKTKILFGNTENYIYICKCKQITRIDMESKNSFIDVLNFNGMALTENGALTNKSAGTAMVDQFGKAGNYRGRALDEVFADQKALWEEDAEKALRFPFYLRLITRKVRINKENETEKVQKGQGARDESLKRILWLAAFHPDELYKNIWVLPIVGSWKDIWTLMYYDIVLKTNVLDNTIMFTLLKKGLECETHVNLIKKFMPRIKTSSNRCKTDWTKITNQLAKDFANFCKLSYKDYNHLKTSGTAHDFQKIICSKNFDKLNWNLIPGKALNIIANSKLLKNQGLVKPYTEWLLKQPTAKFTGYVHELGHQVISKRYGAPLYQKVTWNKQFDELISKAKKDEKITGNVWCALDTSGSMTTRVNGDISAYDICISLGVFFSTLNEGAFHKNVIMFDSVSHVKQLEGDFTDMIGSIVDSNTAWGGTNFQSVVDEIVRIRKQNPEIPLEDYPKTLLVVSDMQFNPCGKHGTDSKTNYEVAKEKLYECFPTDWVDSFRFIWWDCTSRAKTDFPATIDDGGCYFMSGFDGSIISMICGEEIEAREMLENNPITMEQVIDSALNHEILSNLSV
jgi:hypothetical protein